MTRQLLTKDFTPVVGSRHEVEVKFKPADDVLLAKDYAERPDGFIAGWASTPDLDFYRHVVKAGAFDKSIAEKGLTGPEGIKLLIGHDRSKPAGVIQVLETRGQSLWMEAQLNLGISYVKDIYLAAKDNGGLSFSVGFYLEEYEFKQDANKDEYLQINQGELEEVSLVVFPGNPKARNTIVKSADEDYASISDFEKALVALGVVKSRNDAQRVTSMVKRSPLYRQPGANTPEPAAPVAKDKLDKLSSLLVELKNVCN